jgi:hypothetical protein
VEARLPVLFLLVFSGLSAQTFQLSSPTGAPGDRVIIDLSLKSPIEGGASALQWEIAFPGAQLSFLPQDSTAGPAATGKSLSCAPRPAGSDLTVSTATCILYGGRESVGKGPAARLSFQISPHASRGTVRVRFSQAMAVSKDLKKTALKDAETVVTVR